MRRPLTWVALVLLTACLEREAPTAPSTPIENVADNPAALLGSVTTTFIGTGRVWPQAISNSGVVVGGQDIPGIAGSHAFLWTAAGGLVDLAATTGAPWGHTTAYDASNAGHIVGGAFSTVSGGGPYAWMWTPASPSMRQLSPNIATAVGVNDAGMAVGFAMAPDQRAAAWLPSGVELVTSTASYAYAVNNLDQVVVDPPGVGFAIWEPLRDPTGTAMRLVTPTMFPGSGFSYLQGLAIDDLGRVVGVGGTSSGQTGFLWTPGPGAGTVTRLQSPAGTDATTPWSINSSGEIVGTGHVFGTFARYAVYWRDASSPPEFLPNPLGGSDSWAEDINDAGAIAGFGGSSSFVYRGVLWELRAAPPPPPPPPVDPSAPAITPAVTGTLGANGWHTSNVSVTWSVTDPESAISSQTGCGASSVTTDTHGATFTCTATSGGGTTTRSVTIKRDATPPSVAGAQAGTLGNNGWYTSNVAVSFAVSDATSGIASTSGCDATTVTTDTGGASFTCTATDKAGNSASDSETLKRDATSPVVTYTGNTGTYTVDQTVNITCSATDNLSGIASSTCSDVSGAAYAFTIGSNSYAATATDNAGNSGGGSTSFTVVVTYASLAALVDQFVGDFGVGNSLRAKLANAEAAGDRGSATAEQNMIRAFVNEVNAQAGKAISAADAALLIALAGSL